MHKEPDWLRLLKSFESQKVIVIYDPNTYLQTPYIGTCRVDHES